MKRVLRKLFEPRPVREGGIRQERGYIVKGFIICNHKQIFLG